MLLRIDYILSHLVCVRDIPGEKCNAVYMYEGKKNNRGMTYSKKKKKNYVFHGNID